jgi:hypothetical protein
MDGYSMIMDFGCKLLSRMQCLTERFVSCYDQQPVTQAISISCFHELLLRERHANVYPRSKNV